MAGTFVVLRGMAFIGDALAHGVLPGVAGAILLGVPATLGAAVGAGAMIFGVTLITKRSRLSSDTAIGLLFVGMLALGVVMVSRSDSFTGDIVTILFGDVLGLSTAALVLQLCATVGVALVIGVCARPFLLLCFDAEQADAAGFPSHRYHMLLMVVVAATVIASFQTVGTLLVFGMLLAPASAGALIARRVGAMMAWAAALGAMSVYVGLLISYHWDLAASAAIVLVAVVLFFVVFVVQSARQGWRGRAGTRPAEVVT
jgi:ABC-type Mn2+/Zn2+ transport system permease subunit